MKFDNSLPIVQQESLRCFQGQISIDRLGKLEATQCCK